ncbi:hypothetical protein [Bifidobacterium commune]|uniref:hypothetical protein n=1 Tax=Bifidobacterium commune TaxID=1505727 RepID=UPI0013564568|nr:hypothetical protein [Bifidobacterium commune]
MGGLDGIVGGSGIGDLDSLGIWDDSRNRKPERCILRVPVSNRGKAVDPDSYLWM